jgi:hypothetical protein
VVVSHLFLDGHRRRPHPRAGSGRLVEQGTHQELIAAGGRYADLYTIQATAYAAVSDG